VGRLGPELHPVAAKGFGGSVEAYRRSRPSYPAEAVAWLAEALGIGVGRTVVDVGAGTGKFTALLVPTGASLIAVEPLESMRAGFSAELPGVRVVEGSAEALPLEDGSADAIVSAQAFHWFVLDRALPEFARVLRPAGRLGVIWNDLDISVDWVAEFSAIISPSRSVTPLPGDAGRGELGPFFGEMHRASFKHGHRHDPSTLLDRVESMSFVAVLPDDERAKVFDQVRQLVATHPQLAGRQVFELPYVTEAYWVERV
jgi:SAM-dependent methyltransferase